MKFERAIPFAVAAATFAAIVIVVSAFASGTQPKPSQSDQDKTEAPASGYFKPEEVKSTGLVKAGGVSVDYEAHAGTIVVHPKGWDDVPAKAEKEDKEKSEKAADENSENPTAEASMFYVAYFKRDSRAKERPVMFLFNGGPGSSTIWLHMGAFGPRRVVTPSDTHLPAAPYQLVDNAWSLLDVSDLVFIDAPGTGFSRIAGKDKEKSFYGVDQDAYAFSEFIVQFLSKYGRWNSPKYLFGESYGTTRNGALINVLENDRSVDFNGVIMLSQILNFDLSADEPQFNPSVDLPYQLALPTYAASAWYHHKLPKASKDLQPFLNEVENFAMTEYGLALQAGANLSPARRDAIANKLHDYTGLPVAYIKKADLRINGGEFEKTLQDDTGTTTGRLDTRFSGPTLDPLSKEADYDPQSSAISSGYVSAFNAYVRKTLKYGEGKVHKPGIDVFRTWNYLHQAPGAPIPMPIATNVMPDLAAAMIQNPNLKVMLTGGYFDLATPFYEGIYEMKHLAIPAKLQSNIEYAYYPSGHMIYANQDSLKTLHDNVADFIRRTDNISAK